MGFLKISACQSFILWATRGFFKLKSLRRFYTMWLPWLFPSTWSHIGYLLIWYLWGCTGTNGGIWLWAGDYTDTQAHFFHLKDTIYALVRVLLYTRWWVIVCSTNKNLGLKLSSSCVFTIWDCLCHLHNFLHLHLFHLTCCIYMNIYRCFI